MQKLIVFISSFIFLLANCYSQSGWHVLNTGTTNTLYSVSFTDGQTGWSAGSGGVILKTTNGGNNWNTQSSAITSDLLAIKFVSANTGIAAGANGKILRTVNGGANWLALTSGTTGSLKGIYFANTTTGWICGDNGIILKSIDAGATWLPQNSGVSSNLSSVCFSSVNNGWAVGETGKILKTVNGGTNWSVNTDLAIADLSSVSAPNDSLVVISGKYTDGGGNTFIFFFRTVNAGFWWEYQNSGVNSKLHSVFLINQSNGWAAGDNGIILGTTNGGASWINQYTYNSANLYTVNFPVFGAGYSAGSGGTILKTINNGYMDTVITNRRDLGVIPLVLHNEQLVNAKYRVQFKNPDTSFAILRSINNGASFDTLYNNLHLDDTGKVFDGILARVSRIRFYSFAPPGNYVGNCGVIRDPTSPPDSIQSRFYGWDYFPPQNKYLEGSKFTFVNRAWQSVSMSLSYPTRSTYVGLRSLLNPENLRKVKLVFTGYGSGQMAYRYLSTSPTNYQYQDMREIPLKAYEIDETDGTVLPRQVNCAFLEFPGTTQDNKWEPTADSLGGKEILYIFSSNYSQTPDTFYTHKNLFLNQTITDIMYVWSPKLISAGMTFHVNDEFIIYPYTVTIPETAPGYPLYYEFSTEQLIGIETISNNIPVKYSLMQNYPNPFNPVTTIKFSLPQKNSRLALTTLKIYDILGRLVETLVNTTLLPGEYKIEWNASLYASGVYFYRLESGDYSESKKMVLIK